MPPQEGSPLLPSGNDDFVKPTPSTNSNNGRFGILPSQFSFGNDDEQGGSGAGRRRNKCMVLAAGGLIAVAAMAGGAHHHYKQHHQPSGGKGAGKDSNVAGKSSIHYPAGPYQLVEKHVGKDFMNYYTFYDGADSLGSAGYNTYVGQKTALSKNLYNVTQGKDGKSSVYMKSAFVGENEFRESVRLEGKTRFNHGLFILDLDHMPTGCGVWPAWWLTDEDRWPYSGEIDVVEGINEQSVVKTALHTSDKCDMYAHVSDYWHTGHWDRSTGIPDTYTGKLDFNTSMPADNCWVMAPHQWANQGCVAVHQNNGTLGTAVNQAGGAIYVLEWDPSNKYIRSWVFRKDQDIPANLHEAISNDDVKPDPMTWGYPYAYFAIGEGTGCSADHFQNMRLVLNLAFCGTVAGNRFGTDCPALTKQFAVKNPDSGAIDPVLSCNAYISSNPKALDEAYWKIGGVYVYERDNTKPVNKTSSPTSNHP